MKKNRIKIIVRPHTGEHTGDQFGMEFAVPEDRDVEEYKEACDLNWKKLCDAYEKAFNEWVSCLRERVDKLEMSVENNKDSVVPVAYPSYIHHYCPVYNGLKEGD